MDVLLQRDHSCLSVLDISAAALDRARARIGEAASAVRWIAADVTAADWDHPPVDIWHDRAVFHFLTRPEDRARYVARLQRTVKRGGHAAIGTFALDGPLKCSGLDVCRYSADSLTNEIGTNFTLVESAREDHRTPSEAIQHFQWGLFRRV